MTIQQKSKHLEITISDTLYQWLLREATRRAEDISTVIQAVLEDYAKQFDVTQTQTWQLRGAFTIAEPASEYIVDSDDAGEPVTNYAENVDNTLYKRI